MKHTPSVIAFVAALGLVALTVGAVFRPEHDLSLWRIGTMALAWVAVLASALAARDRGTAAIDEDQPREHASRERDPNPPRVSNGYPHTAPAPPASTASPALLDFARELHGTLESDRLRLLISRRLPLLLGVRDVWIVARFGTRQQIIVPSSPTGDAMTMISDEPRQWATFPLKADGHTIGLMGAAPPPGGFSEQDQRMFKLVGSLVAQSLATATTFEAMREASLVDSLTGCATRAEGSRRLEAELRRAQRSRTSLAVLMLDLDHFKSINDRFGHKTGDAALTAVGETLLATLRASDVRCRWGGEEFLLVLPDSNVERAQRAAEKLRQRIAHTPIGAGDQIVHVTASIGCTLTDPDETDMQQSITRADAAMYDAKGLGRNRVSIFLPEGKRRPRPAEPRPGTPAPNRPTPPPGPDVRLQVSEGQWNGVERRDPHRHDRRHVPSPGRRATDAVVSVRWSDS